MVDKVDLYGRIFVRGQIEAVTGLHIGGSPAALAIGSVDNPVIRDALSGRPYIPGSSIRGKMRSLWEKMTGVEQNWSLTKGRRIKAGQHQAKEVVIHLCNTSKEYEQCPVCQIYGVMGQSDAAFPTRLVVRDAFLSEESQKRLKNAKTDLPYTEVKWEAAIDRITSAATPRQVERVPAGAVFDRFEMVFSVYDPNDLARFLNVLEAMQLVEDDYLGGLGSRGSGKVKFENLQLSCRARNRYADEIQWPPSENAGLGVQDILAQKQALLTWLQDKIKEEAYQPTES
ncbi:MAG TPA: type III-A CRISPR-associated RAMP protein Csm3 [Anaerolineae bacterium]|nr:type III-A CRISPR-associated RAMP protein Csm3 [Anaerolineae bacterium]